MRILTIAVFLTATVALADDSVLVALAKRTHRKDSKTPVITNETLATSTGRLSIATGEVKAGPSVAPPAATGTKVAVVAVPANTPTQTARNIPAQSSAATEAPQSSAGTVEPKSSAANVEPQSSARSTEPRSTASSH